MKLRPMRIRWRPITQLPTEPGVYLVWSPKVGARVESCHPSWWNYRPRGKKPSRGFMRGPTVRKWAYLWPIGYLAKGAHNGS